MKARAWFEARGRSMRSRGLSWAQAKQAIGLYALPGWAQAAVARGHLLQDARRSPALRALRERARAIVADPCAYCAGLGVVADTVGARAMCGGCMGTGEDVAADGVPASFNDQPKEPK